MTISAKAVGTSSCVQILQIEMVRKMNKFLAADVLIESAELGNQLLDLGMQDEGGRRRASHTSSFDVTFCNVGARPATFG